MLPVSRTMLPDSNLSRTMLPVSRTMLPALIYSKLSRTMLPVLTFTLHSTMLPVLTFTLCFLCLEQCYLTLICLEQCLLCLEQCYLHLYTLICLEQCYLCWPSWRLWLQVSARLRREILPTQGKKRKVAKIMWQTEILILDLGLRPIDYFFIPQESSKPFICFTSHWIYPM